jgi:hypothetical protein
LSSEEIQPGKSWSHSSELRMSNVDAEDLSSVLLPSDASSSALDALLGLVVSDAVVGLLSSHRQQSQLNSLSAMMAHNLFLRRVRECEEGGRRQAQEEWRHQREKRFTQHQHSIQAHTVRHHTQRIIQLAIDRYGDNTSLQRPPPVVLESELRVVGADCASECVAELLCGFVFPAVVRMSESATSSVSNRRFLDAAHRALLRCIPHTDTHTTATAT